MERTIKTLTAKDASKLGNIDVIIPYGYDVIGENIFARKKNNRITSIIIPDSVTTICDEAFKNCKLLTTVYIPSSVTMIGENVFTGCESLIEISVDEDNPNYSSENGILYNKSKTKLLLCLEGKTGSIIIPDSVVEIDDNAFYHCRLISSVEIPDSVLYIGKHTFSYSTSLHHHNLPIWDFKKHLLDAYVYDFDCDCDSYCSCAGVYRILSNHTLLTPYTDSKGNYREYGSFNGMMGFCKKEIQAKLGYNDHRFEVFRKTLEQKLINKAILSENEQYVIDLLLREDRNDYFPIGWSVEQIFKAIEEAYRTATIIRVTTEYEEIYASYPVLYEGKARGNMNLHFYFDFYDENIYTAYPPSPEKELKREIRRNYAETLDKMVYG